MTIPNKSIRADLCSQAVYTSEPRAQSLTSLSWICASAAKDSGQLDEVLNTLWTRSGRRIVNTTWLLKSLLVAGFFSPSASEHSNAYLYAINPLLDNDGVVKSQVRREVLASWSAALSALERPIAEPP